MSELALSTQSQKARDAYLEGAALLLAAKPSPELSFRRAVAEDPRFALAHACEARALFMLTRIPEAKAAALMARELAKDLPQREKNNVEVVVLTIEGGAAKAYALAREHLRDALARAAVAAGDEHDAARELEIHGQPPSNRAALCHATQTDCARRARARTGGR